MYIPLDLGNPLPAVYHGEIFIHTGNDMSMSIDIYSFFYVMYVYVNKRKFERMETGSNWYLERLASGKAEKRTYLFLVTYFHTTLNFVINKK